jgi:hypothetical protein
LVGCVPVVVALVVASAMFALLWAIYTGIATDQDPFGVKEGVAMPLTDGVDPFPGPVTSAALTAAVCRESMQWPEIGASLKTSGLLRMIAGPDTLTRWVDEPVGGWEAGGALPDLLFCREGYGNSQDTIATMRRAHAGLAKQLENVCFIGQQLDSHAWANGSLFWSLQEAPVWQRGVFPLAIGPPRTLQALVLTRARVGTRACTHARCALRGAH